jgi:uncharacterized protein YyaL (SSP411 family)
MRRSDRVERLMIHALAECGAVLEREDALDAARAAAEFI